MPKLLHTRLDLPRCPHCGVDLPDLRPQFNATDFQGVNRFWAFYACARCCGVVTGRANNWDQDVLQLHPSTEVELDDDIPERGRVFLRQAIDSTRSPSGAVMLAASAVDALLKAKGLKVGSLYERINEATAQHLITTDGTMGA